MRLRPFVVIVLEALLFLTLIFLASCAAPPVAIPSAEPGTPESALPPASQNAEATSEPTVTNLITTTPLIDLRAEVCKSYMDVFPDQAFERYEFPVFWTFYTNFYDPQDQSDPSIRLGCLRFYWRDVPNATFAGTIASTVLIECHTVGTVKTVTAQDDPFTMFSSNNARQTGESTMPDRRAHFDPGAYLTCPFDLNQSLDDFHQTTDFTDEMALLDPTVVVTVEAAINSMILEPNDSYQEFTMAAAAEGASEESMAAAPLIFYQPDLVGKMTEELRPAYEIAFSVGLHEDPVHDVFEAQLGTYQTNSDLSIASPDQCDVPLPAFYGWANFGACMNGGTLCTPGFEFLNRTPGDFLATCSIPDTPDSPSEVSFWAGASTVYIGYNPETELSLTEPTIYYEAWIDPDGSTRPPN